MTVRVLRGDCRDVLRGLPDRSVHCVVTSPPYWGLRDYGTASWEGGDPACDHLVKVAKGKSGNKGNASQANGHGERLTRAACRCGARRVDRQIGLETDYRAYVAEMVEVFRQVRRVLRDDGTVWLNLGDSYAASGAKTLGRNDAGTDIGGRGGNKLGSGNPGVQGARTLSYGVKPKDLLGIPWRVALALQDDGWWLRSDIIWHKRNPMPESVTDRPATAHEYVFLLTKAARYFYDAEAIKEDVTGNAHARGNGINPKAVEPGQGVRMNKDFAGAVAGLVDKRNARSVWEFSSEPFAEAHFATFPSELPLRCIKAGTSERGVCARCGAPWARQIKVDYGKHRPSAGNDPRSRGQDRLARANFPTGHGFRGNNLLREAETVGWLPSCDCGSGETRPAVVLDPFGGAGTTGMVADRLRRDAILIELNPEYCAMVERRIVKDAGLFADLAAD